MKKQNKNGTRSLMGIDELTGHSIATPMGELVFYIIQPTNIGVLPESSITARVRGLQGLLSGQTDWELMALNSRESFEANKSFYRQRREKEPLPTVRRLLELDSQHLDDIQVRLASGREFYLVLRLRGQKESDILPYLSRIEQIIKNNGFTTRMAGKQEIKQMLAVYFEQNMTADGYEDYDGQRWEEVKPNGKKHAKKAKKKGTHAAKPEVRKDFLDMIAPSVIKFNTDHFICGNTWRCVWALREYPSRTDEQAILRHLGEKDGISLRIYARRASPMEEKKILTNASNKNKMNLGTSHDMQEVVAAQSNLSDMAEIIKLMQDSHESLLHCAVYIELSAPDYDSLKLLQIDVQTELIRSKLNVDRLLMRQQQGFRCVSPAGYNAFGPQFERVLPASSVANLYPFNYSGKTDPRGFYIGKDKYGTNVLVDFDQRDDDKTSANILILGNSGQGKSYLMKLLILNLLEAGKSVISLDGEHEQQELCEAVGGYFVDLMEGQYRINVLEPKCWRSTDDDDTELGEPDTFRKHSVLAQHISFLKDFFRSYKNFSDAHIDTIEILLARLYVEWGISEDTDFKGMRSDQFPILSDLYTLILREFEQYDQYGGSQLYTKQLLQEVLLGLHSICIGTDSQMFNGHTNISSSRFLVFGVKGILTAAKNVKAAMLFNILSFMSDKLLTEGNTVAALDELYQWLDNRTTIEYIRNCLKRVRKKESAMMMASQNIEDFDQPNVREMTRPLFAIPPHQFLFFPGSISKAGYMDMLQLEDAEYELIHAAQRGICLYKCGNERYLLEVHAPPYKEALFGKAGGR